MATAGDGGNLDWLERQVEATRSELAEVSGTLGVLAELVHDLARKRPGDAVPDHQAERWQARLGSLETRFEMLETAIRSEVDRLRATAGAVDALADDFRTTVGGTKNLVDLAGDINDRVAVLHQLEREVRGATQEIADTVAARIAAEAEARQEDRNRTREHLNVIERAVDETHGQLATLREHLDALAHTAVDRETVQTTMARAAAEQGERTARLDGALEGLRDRIDAVQSGLGDTSTAQEELVDRLAAVRDELASAAADRAAAQEARLGAVQAAIDELRQSQPDLRPQLEQVASAFIQLRSHLPDPRPQLEQLATAVDELRANQPVIPDHTADLVAVRDAIDELRADQPVVPDHTADLVALRDAIDELRANQPVVPDHTTDFAALRDGLAELRAAQPIVPDHRDELGALRDAIDELRSQQPDVPDHRAELDALRTAVEAASADRPVIPDHSSELAALRDAIDELRANQPVIPEPPDPRPQLEALGALRESIDELRTQQPVIPDYTAELAALRGAIDELRANQPVIPEAPDARPQLEQLTAAIDQLRAQQPAIPDHTAELAALQAAVDELRGRDLDVRPQITELGQAVIALAGRLDRQLAELRESIPAPADPSPALEQLAGAVTALRQSQPEPVDVTPHLEQVRAALEALGAAQPQLTVRLDQLAADVAELRSAVHEARPDDVTPQLAHLRDEMVALRATPPPEPVDLGPLFDRLDRMHAELGDVRVRLATDDGDAAHLRDRLDALAAAVDALHADRLDPSAIRSAVAETVTMLQQEQRDALERIASMQPDTSERIDRLRAEVAELRSQQPDLGAAVQPVLDQLGNVTRARDDDAQRVEALHAAVAESNARLVAIAGDVAATVAALHESRRDDALQPVFDRLAAVIDAVGSIHADMGGMAEAIAAARADRNAFTDLAATTTERIEELAAAVADLRTSRPDVTSSLQGLRELVESLQAAASETQARLGSIEHELASAEEPSNRVAELLVPLTARLDAIVARTTSSDQRFDDVLAGLALTVDQLEQDAASSAQRASATDQRLDDLRQLVASVSDRQAGTMTELLQRLTDRSADDRFDQRIAEVHERIAALAAELANTAAAVHTVSEELVGVRSAFRSDIDALAHAVEEASASRGVHELLARDPTSNVIEVLGNVRQLQADLEDVRGDLRGTRAEILAVNRAVESARAEQRRDERDLDDVSAALVASAASALSRLEGRIDGEFDAIGRQIEALGTLLGQTIDAVHQMGTQLVGEQASSERMRISAETVLEALRANVRQRANRRSGPPAELEPG